MKVYRRLGHDRHEWIGTTTDEQGAGYPVRTLSDVPNSPHPAEWYPRRGIVLEPGQDPTTLPGWKPVTSN